MEFASALTASLFRAELTTGANPVNIHREGKMRDSPRSWLPISCLVCFLSLLAVLPKPVLGQSNQTNQVVLIFGGDVEWSLNARPPTVRYRTADPTPYGKIVYGRRDVRDQVGDWPPFPTPIRVKRCHLKSLGLGPERCLHGRFWA
jgi:hypothetical protein